MARARSLLVHLHLLVDPLLPFPFPLCSPLCERLYIVLLKTSDLLGHVKRDDILVDGAGVEAEGGEVQVGGESPGPALVGGGGGAVVGQADHVGRQPGSGGLQQGGQ